MSLCLLRSRFRASSSRPVSSLFPDSRFSLLPFFPSNLTRFFRLENYRLSRQNLDRTDLAFPDEVDTPKHIPASTRFARYRGLKSFRTSPWDPYENLPVDYAKIFGFEDYDKTGRRVLREGKEVGVEVSFRPLLVFAQIARFYKALDELTRSASCSSSTGRSSSRGSHQERSQGGLRVARSFASFLHVRTLRARAQAVRSPLRRSEEHRVRGAGQVQGSPRLSLPLPSLFLFANES